MNHQFSFQLFLRATFLRTLFVKESPPPPPPIPLRLRHSPTGIPPANEDNLFSTLTGADLLSHHVNDVKFPPWFEGPDSNSCMSCRTSGGRTNERSNDRCNERQRQQSRRRGGSATFFLRRVRTTIPCARSSHTRIVRL